MPRPSSLSSFGGLGFLSGSTSSNLRSTPVAYSCGLHDKKEHVIPKSAINDLPLYFSIQTFVALPLTHGAGSLPLQLYGYCCFSIM